MAGSSRDRNRTERDETPIEKTADTPAPAPDPGPALDAVQAEIERRLNRRGKIEDLARAIYLEDLAAHFKNERGRNAGEAAREAIKLACVFVLAAETELPAIEEASRPKPAAADVESEA